MNELMHLLSNPAHWAFEGITGVVEFIIGIAFGRVWLIRHDRKRHGERHLELVRDERAA